MNQANNNLPRDVFMHLLAIVTMVISAVSFGVLVFQYINIYFPDIISDPYFSSSYYSDSIRNSLSFLIIVFPVYLWSARFLRKELVSNPEKRDLKIRRWLLYLTLFVAGGVIIGDLVTLLRSFLAGELSSRFILKVISILGIAGVIFIHYFSELKEKSQEYKWINLFDKVIITIVAMGIVGAFFVIGSPQKQRQVRLDDRRVSDLQIIQGQVINYWQSKERLPENLSDLENDIIGFVVPVDPETVNEYKYNKLNTLSFELCAVFNLGSLSYSNSSKNMPAFPSNERGIIYGSNWEHSSGEQCFTRDIDPDLFPPNSKIIR